MLESDYIVVWLQRETKQMIASVVRASYPDEAITKVFKYHAEIEPQVAPSGTVFVGRMTEDRDGGGRMLIPWMGRIITKIEARPIYCYDQFGATVADLEGRETLQALDNLAYEAEDYGDSEFDAANENWDLQIKRDAEAERKYGEYLDRYDDQYDYFWDDWDDDWDDDDDFIKENKSEPELTVVDGVPTPPKTHWNGYEWATDHETQDYLEEHYGGTA